MTQNAHYGSVSRAMRNRVNEICICDDNDSSVWMMNERDSIGVLLSHIRHIEDDSICVMRRQLVQFVYGVYRCLCAGMYKRSVFVIIIYCFIDTRLHHLHAYDLLLAVQRVCASLIGRNDFTELIDTIRNSEMNWQRHPIVRHLCATFCDVSVTFCL
jgi:hypothetical protein